jgi:hypothetical protein
MKRKRDEWQQQQSRSSSLQEINRFFGLDEDESRAKRNKTESKDSSSSSASDSDLEMTPESPSSSNNSSGSPLPVPPAPAVNPLDMLNDALRYLPIAFVGSEYSYTDHNGKDHFAAKPYRWLHQDISLKNHIVIARIKDFDMFVKTLVHIFTNKSLFKDDIGSFEVSYFLAKQQKPLKKVNLLVWLEKQPAIKFGLKLIADDKTNHPKVLNLFGEMLQTILPTITSSKTLKNFGWDRSKMLNGRMTSYIGRQPDLGLRSHSDSVARLGAGASSLASPAPLSMRRASSAPASSGSNAGLRAPREFKADSGILASNGNNSGKKPAKPKAKPSDKKKSSSKKSKDSAVKTKPKTAIFSDKKAERKKVVEREVIVIDDEPAVQPQPRSPDLSRVLSASNSSSNSGSPASREPMGVLPAQPAQQKQKKKGIRPHSALMGNSPFPSLALSFEQDRFYSHRVDLAEGLSDNKDKENEQSSAGLLRLQQSSQSASVPPLSRPISRSSFGNLTNGLNSSALSQSAGVSAQSSAQFTYSSDMPGFKTAREHGRSTGEIVSQFSQSRS